MATAPVIRVLLLGIFLRCKGDTVDGYNNGHSVSQFGELLKPPPPPPSFSQILPVPFHGKSERHQRQNIGQGYSYLPPPSPPSQLPIPTELKFPAPFYKQYSFNFIPPPQPFSTTPAPSMFQKISGWLFSQRATSAPNNNDIISSTKDCNPCNSVPWLPVIRYDLDAKNIQQKPNPTYGSPSTIAHANLQKPQPFYSQIQHPPALLPSVPQSNYGQPARFNDIKSTYGPPSPTHTVEVASPKPLSSTYSVPSSSYYLSNSYESPYNPIKSMTLTHSLAAASYSPNSWVSSTYGVPSFTNGALNSLQNVPSAYKPFTSTVTPLYGAPYFTTANYNAVSTPRDVEIINDAKLDENLQLPSVSAPTRFKNSYGEPIDFENVDIPYSVSATAAESHKVKTEVLPDSGYPIIGSNSSLALANPAPFSLNRGRNIHALQPVALPNLSVSPLPPIFNARPFRPIAFPKFSANFVQGLNKMQLSSSKVKIEKSVPIAEYTHSVEYPLSIIQSPVIDITKANSSNYTKGYRNLQNVYVVDNVKDISPEASEDHVSTAKSNQDQSFESTEDIGNDLYHVNTPIEYKATERVPFNHRPYFADLRGLKDEDVDKYRTDNNLQNIDSPLLYLKPSVPNKNYEPFAIQSSTSTYSNSDYEIYDEIPTTTAPNLSTIKNNYNWINTESNLNDETSLSNPQQEVNQPKIVQIIIPYTMTDQESQKNMNYLTAPQEWSNNPKDKYQARKVPTTHNTEDYNDVQTNTESYSTMSATEEPEKSATEYIDAERFNTAAVLSDLYDVKEPPFDIMKLQHTIDDWTEQEFSNQYYNQQKYVKQIPEEFLTTITPLSNYATGTITHNYEYYDHEGSSSNHHTVTEDKTSTFDTNFRQHKNVDERKSLHYKNYSDASKYDKNNNKLLIYTAATSFRTSTSTTSTSTTTTTPAPWGRIQTSISPLTKEKVYVVTSKPWQDTYNITNELLKADIFESSKIVADNDVSASDKFSFKSPRFSNRPTLEATLSENADAVKTNSSYGFSNIWHRRINQLEHKNNGSTLSEAADRALEKGASATSSAEIY